MKRSKKFVFIPACLIAQAIRAKGIVKKYPAIVSPILELFNKYQINLIQMPCPEIKYKGLIREPCGKGKYDNPEYRKICREIAKDVVNSIKEIKGAGYEVIAILGIEYSPSCAVNYLWEGKLKKGKGIFIEELEKELEENKIEIKILGINIQKIKKTLKELESFLRSFYGLNLKDLMSFMHSLQ